MALPTWTLKIKQVNNEPSKNDDNKIPVHQLPNKKLHQNQLQSIFLLFPEKLESSICFLFLLPNVP